MSLALQGIGIMGHDPITIGRVYKLINSGWQAEPAQIEAHQVQAEIKRLQQAIATAIQQLKLIKQKIPADTPDEIIEFVDTHLLMLEDNALSERPIELIKQQLSTAEWALQQHRDQLIDLFDAMDDAYLRTRKDDIDHVIQRIMAVLQGQAAALPLQVQGRIVVASDLSPADTIMLHHQGAIGLITEHGSSMSHTAILARSLGIPTLVGAHSAMRCLKMDETIVLDARHGTVLLECDPQTIAFFQEQLKQAQYHHYQLLKRRDEPAITRDGRHILVQGNIELEEDIQAVLQAGGEGVGLYRTEFLYMNRQNLPTEEEHYQLYLRMIETMRGLPLTIRSLDIGMDKPCRSIHHPHCSNPALSLRAVRLYIQEPDLFRTQLRAILRASIHGQVRLMLPMLTNLWEAQYIRALIDDEIQNLLEQGLAINTHLPIGAMIETPAAALTADLFARFFDFLSIGTNDLIQYTLAVDRIDDMVNHLYDPLHPAVLKLIQYIIEAAHQNRVAVSMCGEMAGEIDHIPLLIGMGLDSLSMHPSAIPEAKRLIRQLHYQHLKYRVQEIMNNLHRLEPLELDQAIQNLRSPSWKPLH